MSLGIPQSGKKIFHCLSVVHIQIDGIYAHRIIHCNNPRVIIRCPVKTVRFAPQLHSLLQIDTRSIILVHGHGRLTDTSQCQQLIFRAGRFLTEQLCTLKGPFKIFMTHKFRILFAEPVVILMGRHCCWNHNQNSSNYIHFKSTHRKLLLFCKCKTIIPMLRFRQFVNFDK